MYIYIYIYVHISLSLSIYIYIYLYALEGRELVRHAAPLAGLLELRLAEREGLAVLEAREVAHARVAQGALAGVRAVDDERLALGRRELRVALLEVVLQRGRDGLYQSYFY